MIYRSDQNCQVCKHYLGNRKCLAFPSEIPNELWSGKDRHDAPYPGDQGYLHELKFQEFPELTQEQVAAFAKRGTRADE